MKIKLIDFGVPEDQRPYRPHGNDAGADVYMPYDCTLQPGEITKIPLGFGIEVPDGFAGYVFPRSSMARHYAGGDRGFCDRAWGAAGHRRLWQYREMIKSAAGK